MADLSEAITLPHWECTSFLETNHGDTNIPHRTNIAARAILSSFLDPCKFFDDW